MSKLKVTRYNNQRARILKLCQELIYKLEQENTRQDIYKIVSFIQKNTQFKTKYDFERKVEIIL